MKQKIGFILSASLFFTSLATALDNNIFLDTSRPESIEELSSKIESAYPAIHPENARELAETVRLIQELEREIFLTNQLIELREKGAVSEEAEVTRPREVPEIIEPAPPPIVVAKQISEEPKVSIPREEKSMITEIEERGKTEKRAFVPSPVSRKKIDVYTKEELSKGQSSVVIEKEQSVLAPAPAFTRFMVTDPSILQAVKEDNDRIRITAVGLGKAFLHVWDSAGRRTIQVTIVQKGQEAFAKARKRAIEATQPESFKVRYSFDRLRLNSKSNTAARSYHYTEWFHRLAISGETPWGRTTSRVQYQGKEEGSPSELRRDLSAWDFNLRGEDFEISLGDTGAYFSDITLPHTGYQGLRFRNPDSKKINYDFVWGARGNRMWGYKVLDFDDGNYFRGARFQIKPADFVNFNFTALRADEDAEDIGEYQNGVGMGLNFFDDAFTIKGEAVRSKNEETDLHLHAYKVDSIIRLRDYHLTLAGTYRDIDSTFKTVTGTSVPNTGEWGGYFDAYYQPLPYLRMTGQYNVFRNRENPNLTETQRFNRDARATLLFNIGDNMRFNYLAWNRMREGDNPPSRGDGQLFDLSYNFSQLPLIKRAARAYLRYEPNQYRNLTSPATDYRERKTTVGMRMNVFKNFYYNLQHEWHYRRMLQSGEHGTVKTLTTGFLYSSQIFDTPFYGSLQVSLDKERDVMENIQLTSGESALTGEGEIKYRPSNDFEAYLRVNVKRIRGVLDHSQNRREMRIYGGGSYLFDTTLRWGVGGTAQGFVFNDANGNGYRDPGEEGMPGITVYAGEERSEVTNDKGRFEFRNIKAVETSVMFDTTMLPPGYRSTTPNPQAIALERGLVSEVSFGVMAASEIDGIVFNDVNMNKVFDGGDEGVKNILVKLDDGTTALTMSSGHYRLEDVGAGKRTVRLDAISLPPNLIPLTKTIQTVEAEVGKYHELDFPLYALRTVVGSVFIDINGNNKFDAGEEGIADAQVSDGDNITLTDDTGRYFLKKLKGGTQRIEVDVESIPAGYELIGGSFREVTLSADGEIKEDVDFPAKRK